LAVIPLLIAAIGGHLAARDVPDPKRSRRIRLLFWALFAFGVVATFWQQFRAAQADQARDTREVWAETLALSKFPPPPPPAYIDRGKSPAIPRSYVTFDSGSFRFPERRDKKGQLLQDQHFPAGDNLYFNVYYKATGPNPIELIRNSQWLYVEPDYAPETQEDLIADFKERLSKIHKNQTVGETETLMPGDGRFITAEAADADDRPRILTANDLARLQAGTEIAFVLVEITYKDRGTIHHARRCAWLQPPADPPGIWHFCEGFNKSD